MNPSRRDAENEPVDEVIIAERERYRVPAREVEGAPARQGTPREAAPAPADGRPRAESLDALVRGVEYPAVHMDIVRAVDAKGADEGLLEELRAMTPDRSYDGPDEFMDAYRESRTE